MTSAFWQDVWVDSRKVPVKKALQLFNRELKRAHAPFKAVKAKPAHDGKWTKDGYIKPYRVKVIRTGRGVLE